MIERLPSRRRERSDGLVAVGPDVAQFQELLDDLIGALGNRELAGVERTSGFKGAS